MGQLQDQSAAPADAENTEELDVSSAATSTASDEDLGSSPEGETVESEESLSDVINEAMSGKDKVDGESDEDGEADDAEGDEKKPDAEKAKTKDKPEQRQEAEDEEDDGSDVEEGQKIPYQRFKKVIDQRNDYKEKIESLGQEASQYRQGHQQYEAIQSFMKQNELRTQDVVEALQVAALMNKDPAKAAELLAPKMRSLQQYTGEVLPPELQQRVETGELSAGDAQEIVRTRNENARLQQQQQRGQQERQQQEQQQQVQQVRQSMASAADQTQQRIAEADPEYQLKAPWVRRELRALIAENNPQSPEQAAQLVQQAYANVNRDLPKLAPRKEVRPGPSSTQAGVSASAGREPSSMAEAIAMAAGMTQE